MYLPTEQENEQVIHNFTHHPATTDQSQKYDTLRNIYRDVALSLLHFCPPSRERSLALTKLEEACFWSNAAIARNEEVELVDTLEVPQEESEPTEE